MTQTIRKRKNKRARNLETIVQKSVGAAVLIVLFLAALCSWFFPSFQPQNFAGERKEADLRIHFVDVGQGDCILLELPDGKTMVIDGGNVSAREDVLAYVRSLRIKTIDYLVITHSDADHCGGLSDLVEYADLQRAYLPCDTADATALYTDIYETVTEKALSVQYSQAFEEIEGEGYYLVFLSPHTQATAAGEEENDASAVLWLDYFGTNALFCGDISSEKEKTLLLEWELGAAAYPERVAEKLKLNSTEILKVAHHGSKYSSSEEWLKALNLQTAVISCGAGNSYGHPAGETLENIRTASPDGQIYRTDECGTVIATLHLDGTYEMSYEKQESKK